MCKCIEAMKFKACFIGNRGKKALQFLPMYRTGIQGFFSFYWRIFYAFLSLKATGGTSWKPLGHRPGRKHCQAHWRRETWLITTVQGKGEDEGSTRFLYRTPSVSMNEGLLLRVPLTSFDSAILQHVCTPRISIHSKACKFCQLKMNKVETFKTN